MNLHLQGLEDESSNCTKQSLTSLSICLKYVLESDNSPSLLPLLQMIPLVAKNPYWLVKVSIQFVTEISHLMQYI